jgi:hypothetical protein
MAETTPERNFIWSNVRLGLDVMLTAINYDETGTVHVFISALHVHTGIVMVKHDILLAKDSPEYVDELVQFATRCETHNSKEMLWYTDEERCPVIGCSVIPPVCAGDEAVKILTFRNKDAHGDQHCSSNTDVVIPYPANFVEIVRGVMM